MTQEILQKVYHLLQCGRVWEAKHLIGLALGLETEADMPINETFGSE